MKKSKLVTTNHDLEILYIRTFHIIEGAIYKQLYKINIPPIIGAMVAEIYRQGSPSPTELAKVSRRKPQTITAIVDRMEAKGLIRRVTNERKKNTYRICLTEKGILVYNKILLVDVFSRCIETLTEEKRKVFQECLEEMATHAKKLRM
jgi:DNA-binding MarR family transcriptional regulator